MTEDFDALFEEVAAQRSEAVAAATPTPVDTPAAAQAIPRTPDVHASSMSASTDGAAAPELDQHGKPIFERLGGVVRLLHDSLRELGYDRALNEASTQITDAQDRLEYIATLTEQAANKVLNTIDEGMPAQDVLAKAAKTIDGRWTQLFEGNLSLEEFKHLATDSKQFTATVLESTEAEKARLLAIMMAQDFQDITGQLIKKIVVITQKVENELAQILRDNAPPELLVVKDKPVELMQGPTVSALVQNDVDSLLEGLGF